MSSSNPASLAPFKAWILLLFHGKAQGPEHSPSQIAALLVRARCETSATEVRQALQMWGEFKERKEEKTLGLEKHSLLSPPPEQVSERPSVSHTPVDRPHGTSPFLHDGLEAYIELFGLPKGTPYPSHLPRAQGERPRSQMMERFIGSHDDPYMVLDTREQRRRAALVTPPLEVHSTQCDINTLEVEDDMAVEPSASSADDDSRNLPFFAGLRKGEEPRFLYRDVKQHKPQHVSGQRKPSHTSTTTRSSTTQPSQTLETSPTEDLFGLDEFMEDHDFVRSLEDIAFQTRESLSHGSNYSNNKRKRSFDAESEEEGEGERMEDLERIKRNRDDTPLEGGDMPCLQIRLMGEQGRS